MKITCCNVCDSEDVRIISTLQFYGKDYGTNLYVCRDCKARVGTHGRSETPKGSLADGYTRQWRNKAHQSFDPIWKGKHMSRTQAYNWLSRMLTLPVEETHIGMFDAETCKKVVLLSNQKRQEITYNR